MIWDPVKAKKFMHQVGMYHIKDGLRSEGADLIYEANWGDGCQTKELFMKTFKDICCLEDEDLKEYAFEAMYPVFS